MTEEMRAVNNVVIRPPRTGDGAMLARLHASELSTEFISRLGPRFLRRYHRAFAESPHATALVAADERTGEPVGALFGTLDNAAHSAYLIRRHGLAMMGLMLTRAVGDPKLARDLLKTRGWRYARAALRLSTKDPRWSSGRLETRGAGEVGEVGVLAHVAVHREYRGQGIGASLVSAFRAEAVQAGVQEFELVTTPGLAGAGAFYERLGWSYAGERTSHSGERFSLYRLTLNTPGEAHA